MLVPIMISQRHHRKHSLVSSGLVVVLVAHCVQLLHRYLAGHAQLENVVLLGFETEFIGSVFLQGQGLGCEGGRGVVGQVGVDLGGQFGEVFAGEQRGGSEEEIQGRLKTVHFISLQKVAVFAEFMRFPLQQQVDQMALLLLVLSVQILRLECTMALSAARLRVESFLVISAIKRSSNLASYSLRRSPLTSQVILSLLAWRPMASGEIMQDMAEFSTQPIQSPNECYNIMEDTNPPQSTVNALPPLPVSDPTQQLEAARRRKTKLEAQASGFTCLLIYFIIKAIFLLCLYRYDNFLKHEPFPTHSLPFATLLLLNSYLMLTLSRDPGYEPAQPQECEVLTGSADWCGICGCRMKRRTKHCFRCGRCVRKFDHHCPWIGGCVGEKNHCGFVVLLVTHSLQAVWAMVVCIRSLQLFEYKFKDGSFSQEYGVFAVFALFMGLYLCFAGGVLIFQLYLVTTNTTTREVLDRKKCAYLRGLTYNPFTRGLLGNIAQTACPNPDGEQWQIREDSPPSCLQLLFRNDYYECC